MTETNYVKERKRNMENKKKLAREKVGKKRKKELIWNKKVPDR